MLNDRQSTGQPTGREVRQVSAHAARILDVLTVALRVGESRIVANDKTALPVHVERNFSAYTVEASLRLRSGQRIAQPGVSFVKVPTGYEVVLYRVHSLAHSAQGAQSVGEAVTLREDITPALIRAIEQFLDRVYRQHKLTLDRAQ